MGITRINTNISSITAQRNINITGSNLSRSIERLSSGLRINSASDDAAGLSVANRLNTQVKGLDVAVSNSQDGINMISVAEGALDETTSRLNRVRELALQAANTGVNDIPARNAIQDEVFQSIDEITRIASTTQFASNYLLNGDFSIQSGLKAGQQDYGINIDSSPVASTLSSGTAFLNIRQTQAGSSQIVAGDGARSIQVMSTGIGNQTDIAVSMAMFSDNSHFSVGLAGADTLTTEYFNGVSVVVADTFVFEGVLADGVTKFTGSTSVDAGTDVNQMASDVQAAIDEAEKALFGVSTTASIPTTFRTTVSAGSGANNGRLVLTSQAELINQSSLSMSLIRSDYMVTQANGVTRSGEIGVASHLSGSGQVGNSVTAITGSTFGSGEFEINVQDVQSDQQRIAESTVVFRDATGAIMNRATSIQSGASAVGTSGLVLNGAFDGGIYTGGTTIQDGDMIILRGTNSDGTTFEGSFTFDYDVASAQADTLLNDFEFGSISGLMSELNTRTRGYDQTMVQTETDGVQTRFEDAMFTFTASGTLQLIDDLGRSDSQLDFTLTFQGSPGATTRENYTIQDEAELVKEGYAEQATFSINGGESIRAEAGDVVTLFGPESTVIGVPQEQVTLRVGSGFAVGDDKLQTSANVYEGALNGGEEVNFTAGQQDVVFISGGKSDGPAKFVTVDFDAILDVTYDGGITNSGITVLISTNNSGLNFQIGSNKGQNIQFALGDLKADNLGFGRDSGMTMSDINVTTLDGANSAIEIVDEALAQVNRTRSILGAATNRLESTIANLSVAAENLTASESRIRDADFAKETAEFTRNQVLMQAGVSVLAQANFQSQGFLVLLG